MPWKSIQGKIEIRCRGETGDCHFDWSEGVAEKSF